MSDAYDGPGDGETKQYGKTNSTKGKRETRSCHQTPGPTNMVSRSLVCTYLGQWRWCQEIELEVGPTRPHPSNVFPSYTRPQHPLFTICCYILSPISYSPHCQIHTQSPQGSPGKEKEQNYMQSYIYVMTRLILKSFRRASPSAGDHPDSGLCKGVFINPNYANIVTLLNCPRGYTLPRVLC